MKVKDMENKAKIPTTPNFIICNGVARHISEYDDKALYKIGMVWIENMVKKANKKSKTQITEILL